MSGIAYLRNGVKGEAVNYFDIQPKMMRGEPEMVAKKVPVLPNKPVGAFRMPLIPSAVHQPFDRKVLGLKPSPFSIRTGMGPGPRSVGQAHFGHGRGHPKGLSHMLNGKDNATKGLLLVQADSTYAVMNNKIPVPQ